MGLDKLSRTNFDDEEDILVGVRVRYFLGGIKNYMPNIDSI